MAKDKWFLTWEDVTDWVRNLRSTIFNCFGEPTEEETALGPLHVYGVPRGGSIIAGLLAAIFPQDFAACGSPKGADVIVDDIVDSGRTKQCFAKHNAPFFSLIDISKDAPGLWVVFPWERVGDGTVDDCGQDICVRLLEYIGEDPRRGGLLKTPERFIRAWDHWASGYQQDPTALMKTFDDGAEECDEMVLLRGIPVWSHCEHHLAPFFGEAHIAYVPNQRIIGLSKLSRIVDVFARRLQVQERLTNQIANALFDGLLPKGCGVMLECRHTCMESRGIQQSGIVTTTTALRGVFREDAAARDEFLRGVKAQ